MLSEHTRGEGRRALVSVLRASAPFARGRRACGGQALVEFALIVPLFLLMTIAIVDGARLFTAYVSLTNGVREAALYAADGTSYLKFCTSAAGKAASPAVSVPCPASTGSANKSSDPDNVAYRIDVESSGLDPARIVLVKPSCNGSPCDTATGTITSVTISATYGMDLMVSSLPVIGVFFPNPVTMTATTNATVIP